MNPDFFRGYLREILPDNVDACLAAKAAAAENCSEALCGIQFQFHASLEIDNHSVIAICRNVRDLLAHPDDRLGYQKASGEFIVMTGRPHRGRENFAAD